MNLLAWYAKRRGINHPASGLTDKFHVTSRRSAKRAAIDLEA